MQSNQSTNIILPFFKEIEFMFNNFNADAIAQSSKIKSFPPTDISIYPNVENKGNISVIDLAIAGFTKDDITFELEYKQLNEFQKVKVLTVYGRKTDEFKEKRKKLKEERHFSLEGISYKNFKKEFIVYDNIESITPVIKNGILTITIIEKIEKPDNLNISFK